MINKLLVYGQRQSGFTLIEVLIAIFILITAVVVPLTIGSKAFTYSHFVRDQSVASYLAQEAMEYIRLQRDDAFVDYSIGPSSPWENFKGSVSSCGSSGGCIVDVYEKEITACGSVCPPIFLQADGQYLYSPVSSKSFVRTVKVTFSGSGVFERARVEVNVSWNTNGVDTREFSVINYLTSWQI